MPWSVEEHLFSLVAASGFYKARSMKHDYRGFGKYQNVY